MKRDDCRRFTHPDGGAPRAQTVAMIRPSLLVALLMILLPITALSQSAAKFEPVADPAAVVTSGDARFTVLTPAMIRMEWASDGKFEDRASFAFINRKLPVPSFTHEVKEGWLVIDTKDLTLRYREDGGKFDDDNLFVELKAPVDGKPVKWRPGMEDKGNLQGTVRTLDGVSGSTPLEPGLLSRDGWVVVDDSERLLYTNDEQRWVARRAAGERLDWYFFGYGRDYRRTLRDFIQVAGRIPMPPRYVFGTWWSRYWDYSDAELKDLVKEFDDHDVPLDVLVIDMGWHLDGWTGYTWNPKYFPDPDGFMKWLHGAGLRTTLNLHPADGVKSHEAAFPAMAKALDVDTATTDTIAFDCTDPKFVNAYFEYLHHPLEKQGVDFWWMDWQQGKKIGALGIDPLFWLNYLHWTDMETSSARGGQRPLIFSRWGGLGNHRYQIGFSGDTYCNWQSLAFQPYFTSTAGNVGYAYWSHDIGGHQPGYVEPELYTRWIQFATYNPVLRTHATKNDLAERRIWTLPKPMFEAARAAFQRRYELIPYIYTAARQCYDTGLPLCRPLYYYWGDSAASYDHPNEYLFGDDLLVTPVTSAVNDATRTALQRIWVPPGNWIYEPTGELYKGGKEYSLMVPLEDIPVFVREGAIIPRAPKMKRTSEKPVDPLILQVWPGASRSIRVFEDDGVGQAYTGGGGAWTPVSHEPSQAGRRIIVGPVEGSWPGMPETRGYEVRLQDVWPPDAVTVDGKSIPEGDGGWHYDTRQFALVIPVPTSSVTMKHVIEVTLSPEREDSIRLGLRGRLLEFERMDVALGGDSPAILRENMAIRKELDNRPFKATLLEQAVAWQRNTGIFEKIETIDPSNPGRLQTIARLSGFGFNLEAVGSNNGTVEVQVRADMMTNRRKLPTTYLLEGVPGWDANPHQASSPLPLQLSMTGYPGIARWTLKPQADPQSADLKVDVQLSDGRAVYSMSGAARLMPGVNAWNIVGPFDNPWADQLNTVFGPEEAIDLAATYKGKDGVSLSWIPCVRKIEPKADLLQENVVDLFEVLDVELEDAVAYGLTYLHSDADRDAVLAFGSDDGIAVWVNGIEVHRNAVGRPYNPRQDLVPVKLKKGSNSVLVKISQGTGGWFFGCQVENKDGKPLEGVTASLKP